MEIWDTVDWSGIFGDFLIEAVTEIVSGISGDDESFFSWLSLKSGQAATGGGFANTSFSTDKDPTKSLLIENVLKGTLKAHLKRFQFYNMNLMCDDIINHLPCMFKLV